MASIDHEYRGITIHKASGARSGDWDSYWIYAGHLMPPGDVRSPKARTLKEAKAWIDNAMSPEGTAQREKLKAEHDARVIAQARRLTIQRHMTADLAVEVYDTLTALVKDAQLPSPSPAMEAVKAILAKLSQGLPS